MHRPLVTVAFTLTLASGAARAQAPAEKPPPNAVQKEMALLHAMTVTALVAVENDALEPIPEALEKVHAAKEETEKAIESGAWKPPKPGATVKDFVKQDQAFHKDLERLEEAAKKKDVTATTRQLGVVLAGCTACHVKFKFVPPAPKPK